MNEYEHDSRKKSYKHKEKKKHKKHKSKSKRRSSDSSENESLNKYEWVEKECNDDTNKEKEQHREEWMTTNLTIPTFQKDDIKPKLDKKKTEGEINNKCILDNPGQTNRELNPYWKNGGTGLPENFEDTTLPKLTNSSVGDQGLDWLKRGLKRAKEQAKDENRSLESVAAERWGSLDNLYKLIEQAEEKNENKHFQNKKNLIYNYNTKYKESRAKDNYKKKFQFLKPTEDSFYNSNTSMTTSISKKNWKKKSEDKPHTKERSLSPNKISSVPVIEQTSSRTLIKEESKSDPNESKHVLSDKEMNDLGAKIVKAEIMGNLELASKLKKEMELARAAKLSGKIKAKESIEIKTSSEKSPEVVILTRINNDGFTKPIHSINKSDNNFTKRKCEKVQTHEKGKRVRYFPDDDKHKLQDMFIKEKMSTVNDHLEEFINLAGKSRPDHDYDADDYFTEKMSLKEKPGRSEIRERDRAIAEHQRMTRSLDGCIHCIETAPKHLIVSIGQKVYLSVPNFQSLTDGHCLIVPISHIISSTQLDEEVFEEIQTYKKMLIRMFASKEMDVVMFETSLNLRRFPHMVIECIPLKKDEGALAPIYFKKAILECEKEWATNKKLIEFDPKKHLINSIPKGLPYFAVSFGLECGFAHVVEDETQFPRNFAQEILGGMLDLDHRIWRKNKKENFDNQRSKMLQFAKDFKEFKLDPK